jgi:hypothetical protein
VLQVILSRDAMFATLVLFITLDRIQCMAELAEARDLKVVAEMVVTSSASHRRPPNRNPVQLEAMPLPVMDEAALLDFNKFKQLGTSLLLPV